VVIAVDYLHTFFTPLLYHFLLLSGFAHTRFRLQIFHIPVSNILSSFSSHYSRLHISLAFAFLRIFTIYLPLLDRLHITVFSLQKNIFHRYHRIYCTSFRDILFIYVTTRRHHAWHHYHAFVIFHHASVSQVSVIYLHWYIRLPSFRIAGGYLAFSPISHVLGEIIYGLCLISRDAYYLLPYSSGLSPISHFHWHSTFLEECLRHRRFIIPSSFILWIFHEYSSSGRPFIIGLDIAESLQNTPSRLSSWIGFLLVFTSFPLALRLLH